MHHLCNEVHTIQQINKKELYANTSTIVSPT